MAATGKKGKKAKWVKASITDIIAEPTTIPTTQNWADSVEDDTTESYGYGSRTRAPVVLPSASRAARGGLAVDDESIPRHPPFVAHISNLPYDVDETAITELFDGLKILNLRLPREGDRLKGYGYVDFENRESLINAMNMPDLTIGGRRVRIDVSTQDNDRRMGRTGRNDRERDYDPERTMGDWRSGPRAAPEPGRERDRDRGGPDRGPMTREGMRERDADRGPDRGPMTREGMRERDADRGPMTREGMRERDADRGPMTREGMRERDADRGPMTREGMRERDSDSSAADNRPGGWRDGDRPAADPARTPYGGRDSFGRDRDRDGDRGFGGRERGGAGYGREGERERGGYGGRDGFRAAPERDGGGFGNRDRDRGGFGGRGFGDRDRDPPPREGDVSDGKPRERPKLNLLPRTVPREAEAPTKPADGAPLDDKPAEKPAPKPVSAEKVFGAAKPVDTAAKEREIEERLRKQEEEARRTTDDKERWGGRKNDHSGDRRAGGRRDDRGRDSRSYNKDRRDYSKDSKDRRDYSKDSKDRRDYSKDSKDRRDYSKDSKDRRDYSKDSKDRHDYSRDDKDRRDDRREYSGERRDASGDRRRPESPQRGDKRRDSQERNGDEKHTDETRQSRSRERHDDETERPLPKLKEVEKPNFVASNKFSFLEDDVDAGSD